MRFQQIRYCGRFIIRSEWLGKILVYDVTGRSGLPIAAGFDLISGNEEAALGAVLARYGNMTTV